MTDHLKIFEKVWISPLALKSQAARRALKIFPKNKIHIGEGDFKKGRLSPLQIEEGKKLLALKEFKGRFFRRCPGAKPGLMCCNYFTLNLGQNCEMDCSYCYLQSFVNFPTVVIYTNIEKALAELEEIKKTHFTSPLRIGTGEWTDSLSLDDISLYSQTLVSFFKNCPHWTLEFKTKSANIKNFESQAHAGNVIVSWSVNPEHIVQKEEHRTSPLRERLNSARLALDKGFKVSFHIDPLIWLPDWKAHYQKLVDKIAQMFHPEEIRRISLGALRFQAEQKALMRKRFGMKSLICQGEFFRSKDGKLRYTKELREEMMQYVLSQFKKRSPRWACFLCMEESDTWLNVMKAPARRISSIREDFDLRLVNRLKPSLLQKQSENSHPQPIKIL